MTSVSSGGGTKGLLFPWQGDYVVFWTDEREGVMRHKTTRAQALWGLVRFVWD